MSGLIRKKIDMVGIFDESGKDMPCTIVEAGPRVITQVRTKEVDGYDALRLGLDDRAEKRAIETELGHFKKAGPSVKKKVIEFQGFEDNCKSGDIVTVDFFAEGEFVGVFSISRGKGFQGVVRRHGFGGVRQATHGQHNRLRAPNSVGASPYPSRVFEGMRMAGRTGAEEVTIQNLKVLKVVAEKSLLVVRGCIPGHKDAYVAIHK